MNDTTDNVITLAVANDKTPENTLPFHDYRVVDIEGKTYLASGFLIFTTAHVAVMRDEGNGASPILILPLVRLAVAELADGGTVI